MLISDLDAVRIEYEQLAQIAVRHLRGAELHAVPREAARSSFVVVSGGEGDVIHAAAAVIHRVRGVGGSARRLVVTRALADVNAGDDRPT